MRAQNWLDTQALKLGGWIMERRSASVMHKLAVYLQTLWSTLRCVSTTPFGGPDEPDV